MRPANTEKRVQLAIVMRVSAARALKALSKRSRVPQQEYLREAVDDLLRKYAKNGGSTT